MSTPMASAGVRVRNFDIAARFGHSGTKRNGPHRCKPLIYSLRGQDLNL
jgi:hypothetical protein